MNYQKLIDEIIIMAQEEKTVIETLNIEKNATVEGRTGEYDVDLLWEFFYNSNNYKIISSLLIYLTCCYILLLLLRQLL